MSRRKISEGVYVEDGLVYARVRVVGEDKRKSFGPDSRENRVTAQLWRNEIKTEIGIAQRKGEPWTVLRKLEQSREKRTFAEVATEYMDERRNNKASTITEYESKLTCWILPRIGNKEISQITEAQIARLQTDMALKISPSRTNNVISLISAIFTTAVRRGYCTSNPCAHIKRKQQPKPDIDPLSENELEIALNSLEPFWRPLYTTLAFTGMRQSEALALLWSDVDFVRKELSIKKARVRGKVGATKTAESNRTIPILPPVEQALIELKNRTTINQTGYIFTTKRGEPIVKHIDKMWRKALKKAGLRHRPSEQLRHTFASQCLMKGHAPGYIASLLGHSSLQVTYRHYARWIKDASKEQENALRKSFDFSMNATRESNAI